MAAGEAEGGGDEALLDLGDQFGVGIAAAGIAGGVERQPDALVEGKGAPGFTRGGGASGLVERRVDEIVGDGVTAGVENEMADGVLQLADIAGPGVGIESPSGWLGKVGQRNFELVGGLAGEVIDQRGDVVGPPTERWQGDDGGVDPVEEILAETFFADAFLEILVGGGDDADVDPGAFVVDGGEEFRDLPRSRPTRLS